MLNFTDMFEMQTRLYEAHPEWLKRDFAGGPFKLLWMIGEAGEVIDIVKKKNEADILSPGPVRDHLIEEIADVQMYLLDVMACYGITPDEISEGFVKKHQYNMIRDYAAENREMI